MKRNRKINLKDYSTEALLAMQKDVDQLISIREDKQRAFNEFIAEAKAKGYDLKSLIALMQTDVLL